MKVCTLLAFFPMAAQAGRLEVQRAPMASGHWWVKKTSDPQLIWPTMRHLASSSLTTVSS